MAGKQRMVTLVALLIALTLGTATVNAAFDGGTPTDRPAHRHFGQLLHLLKGMDLTEDQQTTIEAIATATRESIESLVAQLQNLGLDEAIFAETIDSDAVALKIDSMVDLRGQIASIEAQAVLQISQVLTAAQRAEVLERSAERPERPWRKGWSRK